jgi:lysozyme
MRRVILFCTLALLTLSFTCPSARAVVYGVDVYNGNGTINWPLVAGGGKDFAIVKATEGVGFQDAKLSQNEANGTAAGLWIGCYDFAHPENNTPVAEADYFVNYAKQFNAFSSGHLVPALDMETGAGAHVGATSLSAWCNAWCTEVHQLTGTNPLIYTYPSFAQSYLDSTVTSHPLWIASYDHTDPASNPSVTGPWNGTYAFWQYTGSGRLAGGPSGDIDLDEYPGTLASLQANYVIPSVAGMSVNPEPAALALISMTLLAPSRKLRRRASCESRQRLSP